MQLEPCPFCGGEAERLELTDEDNFGGSVICCKQCGASSSVHFDRKENLEDGWNRRVQAVQPVPALMIIQIKPLEWRDHRGHTFPDTWTALTPCGVFEIEERSAGDSPAYFATGPMYAFIADKDSLEEAKAAAQADYERRIRAALTATASAEPVVTEDAHQFKNFHRLLCERFGYCHDEKDWRRDQVSLIEHIAALTEERDRLQRERDEWRDKHDKDGIWFEKYICEKAGYTFYSDGRISSVMFVDRLVAERDTLAQEKAELVAAKDGAYLERNKVVAALASLFPSGVKRTAIPGWSEDWHGCVYIDLPSGQVSWHFHDSQAYLFDSLPEYAGEWDGHDTDEKYRRVALLDKHKATSTEREGGQ